MAKTLGIRIGGIAALAAVIAYGQTDTTASKAEEAVDAAGNLHVPDNYRATYELLGSWAVAGKQGQGAEELHVVFASPGTICVSQGWTFP